MEEGVTEVSVKHRGCCCCNRSCGINDSVGLYGTIMVASASSISIALVVIFVSLDCGLVRRYR